MTEPSWDAERWGPAPPRERRRPEPPRLLRQAAAVLVASDVFGVLIFSRGTAATAVLSLAVTGLVAFGLLRGWPRSRWIAGLGAVAQIGGTLFFASGTTPWSPVVPRAFLVELAVRGPAALFVLGALLAPSVDAYFRARAIERFG